MNRFTRACYLGLLVALTPGLSSAQAVGIGRPMTVPDRTWIERQCAAVERVNSTDDAVAAAISRTRDACATYGASLRDAAARDTWVRAMMAIQDDVGSKAMRAFVPEFGAELPSGLESYSLFLIPDARWRGADFVLKRGALWEAFYAFGRSIGDRHAAIWFLDQEGNIDVERSQEYCRRFNLSYNDGPYVVTANRRPDLLVSDDEVVVIRMGGIDPARIPAVLNRLSLDLGTTGKPGGALVYEELKQRFLTWPGASAEGIRAFVTRFVGQ